jgi:hypothetical protein
VFYFFIDNIILFVNGRVVKLVSLEVCTHKWDRGLVVFIILLSEDYG